MAKYKIVNMCRDCPDYCVGCGADSVQVEICEECGSEGIKYRYGNESYCEQCFKDTVLDDILFEYKIGGL